jgi:hypothetical protein
MPSELTLAGTSTVSVCTVEVCRGTTWLVERGGEEKKSGEVQVPCVKSQEKQMQDVFHDQ